jgi:inorganic pyrophosphatase
MGEYKETLSAVISLLYRAHPWHGVPIGDRAPDVVTAYIEMSPTDTVKYELDKGTGLLKVDRPQKFSSTCPTLYGFIPQTYCAERSGAYCAERTGRPNIVGDGDPLDICILTEKPIRKSNVLIQAIPIGGLRMLDGNEADDKIVAVMVDDETFGDMREIEDCPKRLIDRLRHYFLTYKQAPDAQDKACEITHVYGRLEAREVIIRGREDYLRRYANIGNLLNRPV